MKVFVTGGTGFIGGALVRQLRARGDEVVCLVRTPEKGKAAAALGCELASGALSAERSLRAG
ncbi:MAG TPA: NAD-dependent epimerase/dehydratase family protein, partial [Solirubrobacterales bacterium]|nr:NAD-dependent epimerase/dehydratase family protein [Solirubrobacterales bacterium]